MLTDSEKSVLLDVVRNSILAELKNLPPADVSALPVTREQCGAFVSLYVEGELRGCIGYVEGIKPLGETIQEIACKAAFEDPRFLPLTLEEFSSISIEISVLSPLKLIRHIEEIEVGLHGLYIEFNRARGLLLPQIAAKYNWNRETFLNQTARKAGCAPDAWKHPATRIHIFTAEIFSDTVTTPHV